MLLFLKHKLFFILAGVILIVASLFFITLYLPAPHTTAAGADLNGYIAQYECRAGNPNCNVDVIGLTNQTCQVTVTTADSSWSKITGDSSKTVYCIQAGDHSSKGTLFLGFSGTSGTRKVLRCVTSGGSQCSIPWGVTNANRAIVKQIDANDRDYWIFSRLSIDADNNYHAVKIHGTSNDIILNQILVEDGGRASEGIVDIESADNIVIQNSVVRNCRNATGVTPVAINVGKGDNIWIVNNELYNCPKGVTTWRTGLRTPGQIVENNDIYISPSQYTNCNGSFNTSGTCGAFESLWSTKDSGTQSNPKRIIHNRFWGSRPTDTSICCDGGGTQGSALGFGGGENNGDWILIQDNVIHDVAGGIGGNVQHGDGTTNVSIIGNLIYKIANSRFSASALSTYGFGGAMHSKIEIYLNTVIDAKVSGGAWLNLDDFVHGDIRCNVSIDSNAAKGSLGSGSQRDNQVYYNTSDSGELSKINKSLSTISGSFCTTLGCTSSANTSGRSIGDIVRTTSSVPSSCSSINDQKCFLYQVTQVGGSGQVQAIRGPYAFYRKLQTNPELYIIPYATVHSSAPEQGFCPSSTGSRSGIGINDGAVF